VAHFTFIVFENIVRTHSAAAPALLTNPFGHVTEPFWFLPTRIVFFRTLRAKTFSATNAHLARRIIMGEVELAVTITYEGAKARITTAEEATPVIREGKPVRPPKRLIH
jgi:hypothetical protein